MRDLRPGRRHEVVEEPRGEIAVACRRGPRAPLEMLLDDLLGAAELRERRGAQDVRAALALDLPEPLQHELQIRRLDAARPLAFLDEPAAGEVPLDPAGGDLVEHRLDELVLGRRPRARRAPRTRAAAPRSPSGPRRGSRWSSRRTLPKRPGTRRLSASRSASESSRTPSRTCTGSVGSRQDVLERVGERAAVAPVVEDVLLHLVEDEVELAAPDAIVRSASASASGMSVGAPGGGRDRARPGRRASGRRSRPRPRRSSPPPAGTSVRSRRATPARRSELLPTPLGP